MFPWINTQWIHSKYHSENGEHYDSKKFSFPKLFFLKPIFNFFKQFDKNKTEEIDIFQTEWKRRTIRPIGRQIGLRRNE